MSRWLKLLLLALVIVGAGLVSLPWWLGAVLGPILQARDVTFARYERTGYARFRLHDVRLAKPGFSVTARQVEAPTPLVWLGQRLRGGEPLITAGGWRFERHARTGPASAEKSIAGLPDLQAALQRIAPRVGTWLPRAQLSDGVVQGVGPEMTVARADWRNATLTVGGLQVANREVGFVLTPAADGSVVLTAQAGSEARLRLTWAGADVKGEAVLWDQPAQLSAHFSADGWIPADAGLVAENWRLPAARVGLGVPYAEVLGGARLRWHDGNFDLAVDARAEPAADTKKKAPPFEARATARGNLRELTLTALHVDAPFATARLSSPITFSFDHPLAGASAQLSVRADLGKMPWFEARGTVEGAVTVTGDSAAARQEFVLKSAGVTLGDFTSQAAQVRGTLAWPRVDVAELRVQLDDETSLDAHGAVDWRAREFVGVALDAKLTPAAVARWLPRQATWTAARVTATLEGPLDAPRHEGSLQLEGAAIGPLHPIAVTAGWKGRGRQADLTARLAAQTSTLEIAAALDASAVQVTKLDYSPGGKPAWQLAGTARVAWSPAWQVDDLRLAGPDSQLSFKGRGGADGAWEIAATRFPSAWLQDWITVTGPGWQLRSLQASGRVADRALAFDARLAAQIEMSPQPAEVSLVAHGDAGGIELKELRVSEAGRVLTQAAGRLPVSFVVDPAPRLAFDEAAPLALTASTEPDSPLWATLAAYTGLQLAQPAARLDVKGTLRQPVGEFQARVGRLGVTPGRFKFPVPDCDDLVLTVQLGRDLVTVKEFSARLDGQAVQASGRMPMDDDGWLQLWHAPAKFDWKQAEARLEIPDADLAPLARRVPSFVAAQGRLRARIELAPGGKFAGELHLAEAASRPIPALGSFQEITADLVLADRVITAQKVTARLGGEPVTLDGTVTLEPGGPPRLALALKGTNLPLVRNTGFLLRSDVDLHAHTDAAGVTRLSGAFAVRDCLVLANLNLQTLLPGGRRGVSLQPPYFAVPVDPFRQWVLAVDIRAPGSVRVRTTVYHGVASGLFQLGGTLGEPRAVGQLTVDEGQVLFPFATFQVQQGAIRLREADPFHAAISLNATSQRRDYQLKLEMTGELPAPNIVVTSTPAIEAADVLLMVMTGQPPASESTGTTSSSGQRFALLGAYLGRGLFQDLGFGGEDRLEISAGERISRQGRETYEFEYKLGEHWSVTGEYDEFDAFNAGLRWRVYTEEGAPLERKK